MKAIASPVSIHLYGEARVAIPKCEGVTDVVGPTHHVNERYLGGIDLLSKVERERGVVAQPLRCSHQRDVLAERNSIVRVREIGERNPRAICQRFAAGPL